MSNNLTFSSQNFKTDKHQEGKKALLRYLGIASIKEFWAKLGHGNFLKCQVTGDNFTVRPTYINYDLGLEGEERSKTRNWSLKVINDGYEYVSSIAQKKDGGVFFGGSDGSSIFPLKEYQLTSTQIVTEIDDLSRDEQLEKYKWFSEISGLNPYLISSGGKSIHLHLLLNKPTPIEKVVSLRRLLCLALDGDPAVTRPHQPFRLPSFFRKEKGNYQEVLQQGSNYSYDEVFEGITKVFSALGYKLPESISDHWFTELTSILNSDKGNKGKKTKPITKEEKLERLKIALDEGEKGFFDKRKKTQKTRIEIAKNYKSTYDNISDLDKEKLILELLEHIPRKVKNDGLYEDYRSIGAALKNILGLTRAIELMDQFFPKETGWKQAIDSSHGNFSLGTIIYYAKKWGGWKPESSYIDPEHGKVIASGKSAIARAKKSITDNDVRDYEVISEAEFMECLENKEFSEYQEKFIRQLNKFKEGKEKGFSERFIRIPVEFSNDIIYDPETFYFLSKTDINPDTKLFIPKKHQDPKIYARIITYLNYIGLKHIFLKLQAGQGKSTSISYLDKVLYIDTNYNNPSNPLLKEFHPLTSRSEYGTYDVNGKIVIDPDKKVRSMADQPDSGVIQLKEGNCELKPVFRAFQSKGYSAEGNKAICEKCSKNKTCAVVSGGFRHETKTDHSIIAFNGRGRVHPSQLTTEKIENAFPTFIKVWEEASTLPINSDTLYSELPLRRLASKIQKIKDSTSVINPELMEYLVKSLDFLADILNPDYAKTLNPDNRYFGLSHEVITASLPALPIMDNDKFEVDVKVLLSLLCPDISDLLFNYRSDSDLQRKIEELTSTLDTSPYHLLLALLYGNDSEYCISTAKVEKKNSFDWQLMITSPLEKWGYIAKTGGSNVYLDATATPTQIKAIFNIDDNIPFLTIVNEVNELDNLLVRNINLKGLGSNTWSNEAIARAKRGIELIKSKNPNKKIAVMTLKKYSEEFNTPFWYGKSDRGTNDLIGYDGIIFVGSPFPDVGAIKREYLTLYKHRHNKPTFDQFYSQKRYEQRMQGLARLRSQHSKDKQFFQYYLTTNEDLSYLEEIGVKYQTIEGVILSPDLGSKGDQTFSEICIAAQNFVTSGIDFTLSLLAETIAKTKQAVSKAIKKVCNGFSEFRKCQLNLYRYYIGMVDERMRVLDDWGENLPQDLIDQTIEEVKLNQSDGFMFIVECYALPRHIAYRLLWVISGIFDPRIPQSFLVNNLGEG